MTDTHIHCSARMDERPHVLDETCWCEPTVSKVLHGGRVIDHDGRLNPAVIRGIERARAFDGLAPPRGRPVRELPRRLPGSYTGGSTA